MAQQCAGARTPNVASLRRVLQSCGQIPRKAARVSSALCGPPGRRRDGLPGALRPIAAGNSDGGTRWPRPAHVRVETSARRAGAATMGCPAPRPSARSHYCAGCPTQCAAHGSQTLRASRQEPDGHLLADEHQCGDSDDQYRGGRPTFDYVFACHDSFSVSCLRFSARTIFEALTLL